MRYESRATGTTAPDLAAVSEPDPVLLRALASGRGDLLSVIEHMPIGIVLADRAGRHVYVNAAAEYITGHTGLTAHTGPPWPPSGSPLYERTYHPDGRPYRAEDWPCIRAARGERIEALAGYCLRPDGTRVDLRLAACPVRGRGGQIVGAVGVIQDVTAEQRALNAERLLSAVGKLVATPAEDGGMLPALAGVLSPALADWCCIHLLGSDSQLRLVEVGGRDPEMRHALLQVDRQHGSADAGRSGMVHTARTGTAQLMPVLTDSQLEALAHTRAQADLLQRLRPTSALVVPIVARTRILGVLTLLQAGSRRRFDERDQALAEELGRRAGLALDTAQLIETERSTRLRAEQTLARLRQLQSVTAALSQASSLDDVLGVILDQGVQALAVSAAGIVELDEKARTYHLLHARGMSADVIEKFRVFPVDTPLPTADVARTREPVLLENANAWRARYPTGPATGPSGDGAWAALPLRAGGRLVGALTLSFPTPRAFSPEDRAYMMMLADECGHAIERARLYDAERVARVAAQAASEAKSDFLSVMSHELRTPLSAIIGYCELMERDASSPTTGKQREQLEHVRSSAWQLVDVIDEILTFSRLERGGVDLDVSTINIAQLIRATIRSCQPQAASKGIALRQPLPETLPQLMTDGVKLRHILLRLIGNAIKFTEAGSVTVTATVTTAEVCVTVTDTGPGIAPADLTRIFEPFTQLEATNTRRHPGLGLGLPLSRRFAELLGGHLEVRSEPGAGCAFTLHLPRVRQHAADDAPVT